MKKILLIVVLLCSTLFAQAQKSDVIIGAEQTKAYFPILKNKRIAIFSNHTGMVGNKHLLDILLENNFNVVAIFSPEHGFRGNADAGEHVSSTIDSKTGVPILSLYNGKSKKPSEASMKKFDILIVDIQDVGLRFYTYYISMVRLMDACAEYDRKILILDRPNPNGHYVDGPILDMKYKSGVGGLPIPIVHGMTLQRGIPARLAFDGFMSVYTDPDEEKKEKNAAVRSLEAGTELALEKMDPQQHFTQPPAHYTEASLVKMLEELGIGRPSTYAPTITTIINRRYVAKENKNLYMTELGEVVNNMMKEAFPSIVDVNFTATMEALLDRVGDGSVPWKTVVENFWPDLYEAVTEAEKNLEEVKVEDEVTDVICENCGRNMVVKYGPHGKFLACPGFPDCKNTKPYLEKIGVPCPKCGKEVILRKTKKGRKYYGCENNPECDFMSWQKPSAKKCPQCGGYMLEKGNKLVCADEQCGYVEAREKKDED